LDFNQWGNTPISREMDRVVQAENAALLPFCSSVEFDNRYLKLASFVQGTRGTYATSLIALNFDPISSLRGKDPALWDAQWEGLNVLKIVAGFFNGIKRCFAVCLSQDLTQIEIHEILPSSSSQTQDDGTTPISKSIESSVLFNYSLGPHNPRPANPNHDYLRLSYGEIYVDRITADTEFQVYYKPDQWPNWVLWHSWTEKFNPNAKQPDPGFRPRIGLPEPSEKVFDKTNDRPLWQGFSFQVKIVSNGGRLLGARFSAEVIPQPKFAVPTFTKPTP
jgi:hypothetical protein